MVTAEAGWLDAMRASTTGRGGSRLDPKTSENRRGSTLLMTNEYSDEVDDRAVEARRRVSRSQFAECRAAGFTWAPLDANGA